METEPTDMEGVKDMVSETTPGACEGCDHSGKWSATAAEWNTNPADPVLIYTFQMSQLQ